jgi:hypothetical protein
VKDNTQGGFIDVDLPVGVVDEAHIAEFFHEEIDTGASGANHLRQSFLRNLGE